MDFTATFQQELKLRGFEFNRERVAEITRAFADSFLDFMRNGNSFRIANIGLFTIVDIKPKVFWSNLTNQSEVSRRRRKIKFTPS